MSSLLEQAIIDAKELKEAALKSAEGSIIDKYASEVKDAMNSILYEEAAPAPTQVLEEDAVVIKSVEDAPLSAAAGESMCPCPDEGDIVTIDLKGIEDMYSKLKGAEDMEPAASQEELATNVATAAGEDLEDDMGIQEEIEIDGDILLEDIDSTDLAEGHDMPETMDEEEEIDEEIEIDEGELSTILEELVVDLSGDDLTGWAGRPESDKKYADDIRLARLAATSAQEEVKNMKAAVENLSEANKALRDDNEQLHEAVNVLKGKLDEVNLLNAKLFYGNQTLNSTSLNERQKTKIVESIQKADSVDEAKVLYETLQSAVTSSGKREVKSLNEAIARPSITMPRSRRVNREILQEDIFKDRLQRLAGIKKIQK